MSYIKETIIFGQVNYFDSNLLLLLFPFRHQLYHSRIDYAIDQFVNVSYEKVGN